MTGLLAVVGVVLVLTASAYIGLTATEDDVGATTTDGDEVSEPAQRVLITPVVSPTPEPEEAEGDQGDGGGQPEATPTPVLNRENCDEIRGTDYRSPGERTWFLANCVNN